MEYKNVVPGIFIDRPNRFIANVDINGAATVCHVKNTGRCKELFVPGARVYVQRADNPERKTAYDLITVEKEGRLFNVDSSAPNKVFREWAEERCRSIRSEVAYGRSRLDFLLEDEQGSVYVEVKGVTLVEGKGAMFPDAPTLRGIRHLGELEAAVKNGHRAWAFFVIKTENVEYFSPNERNPDFVHALRHARNAGVNVMAYECLVGQNTLKINKPVAVRL